MSWFRLFPCPFSFFVLCAFVFGASASQVYASVRSFSPSHAWDAKVIEHPALPPRVVAVDKKQQILTLLEFRSSLESTTTYLCSTGQTPGDKIVEGDLKTPEGIYFVVQHLSSGLDFDMYGYEAYTLNYPNPVDKIRRKTGYGIWVHGKGNGIAPLQTQGCIALNNNDLNTLGNKLTPGMPVIISNSVDLHNPSGSKISSIQTLQDLSVRWAKAWGDRSTTMFDFYDQEAYSIANEPFSAFKNNKERLFKRLPWIKTSIRDIQVLEGPGYWVTWFYQDYQAPNLTSKGVRRLYWSENTKGEFKIIGMEWLPGLNTSAQLVREDPPTPPIDKAPKTETVPQKFDTLTAEMTPNAPSAMAVPQGPSPKELSGKPAAVVSSRNTAESAKMPPPDKDAAPAKPAPPQETPPQLTESATGGVVGAAYSPTPLPVIRQSAGAPSPKGLSGDQMPLDSAQKADSLQKSAGEKILGATQQRAKVAETVQNSKPLAMVESTARVKEAKAPATLEKTGERLPAGEQIKPGTTSVNKTLSDKTLSDKTLSGKTLSDRAVLSFIEGWRIAWEQGNLEEYLACYANNAIQDRRTSKAAIKHHKKTLWKRAHPKTVALANIHISRRGTTIVATMQQQYTSRNGTGDKGKKTLHLREIDGAWRIVKETWSKN